MSGGKKRTSCSPAEQLPYAKLMQLALESVRDGHRYRLMNQKLLEAHCYTDRKLAKRELSTLYRLYPELRKDSKDVTVEGTNNDVLKYILGNAALSTTSFGDTLEFEAHSDYLPINLDLLRLAYTVLTCPLLTCDRITTLLIRGRVGCGKTSFVEYLARKSGHMLEKVQLSGQTDLANLVGTYKFTGEDGSCFSWIPGPVTRAALTPNTYLLLEDIDQCPADFAAFLSDLVENRSIRIRGGEEKAIETSFRIIITEKSDLISNSQREAVQCLKDQVVSFVIDLGVGSDYEKIAYHRFPSLPTSVVKKVIEEYQLATAVQTEHRRRTVTLRDVLKCLKRQTRYSCSSKTSIIKNASFPHLQNDINDCFGVVAREIPAKDMGSRPPLPDLVVSVTRKQRFALTDNTRMILSRMFTASVVNDEACLLIGRTGVGKTTCVQVLASASKRNLTVVNMSQQSDAFGDLIGSYRPTDHSRLIDETFAHFVQMFSKTFDRENNAQFIQSLRLLMQGKKYLALLRCMRVPILKAINKNDTRNLADWKSLLQQNTSLKRSLKKKRLAFQFVKGPLIKALENGDWLLLDEINLANDETLAVLDELLDSGSVSVYEKGDETCNKLKKVSENFRLFACMNPPDMTGNKRSLPLSLRSRFTEIVLQECADDVESIIRQSLKDDRLVHSVLTFFNNHRLKNPSVNLRTLCRSLAYATQTKCKSKTISLRDGLVMCFASHCLTKSDKIELEYALDQCIAKNDSKATRTAYLPNLQSDILVEGYWLREGKCEQPSASENYILTDNVKKNVRELSRALSFGRFPILLQGETSVGKTSLVQWLASQTKNKLIRINNHEHTDLSEYVGVYSSDENGNLRFQYGALAQAMIDGDWVLLDELNLAPNDVLEALNRVLDDNNELFIAETGERLRPSHGFQIIATQNPAGSSYQGRKRLSEAFRSRFIEIHFERYTQDDLERILCEKSNIPPSYGKRMLRVFSELERHRSTSFIFSGKSGLVTLRDLFRWANRLCAVSENEDALQYMADMGYLLLSGRSRCSKDATVIQSNIETAFSRTINPEKLFAFESATSARFRPTDDHRFQHLVWTRGLRRMFLLSSICHHFDEPFLLVGRTGCGKTTICQLLAESAAHNRQNLFTANCHAHTEAGDFVGNWHPSHTSIIEWKDGQLVKCMREGGMFLLDEITLADDSVLERLNSLLDSDRSIFVAERPVEKHIRASSSFRIAATMNPSGDYGKRELSTALRNRFTEIYCDDLFADNNGYDQIVCELLTKSVNNRDLVNPMITFAKRIFSNCNRDVFTTRDLISWAAYVNKTNKQRFSRIAGGFILSSPNYRALKEQLFHTITDFICFKFKKN